MTTTKTDRAAVAVVEAGGYSIGWADRDVRGYTPTSAKFSSYEEAKAAAETLNGEAGLSPEEASSIVISTMRRGDQPRLRTDPDKIVCPRCGRATYNPQDIQQQYCGQCHMFHADMDEHDELPLDEHIRNGL